MSNPKKQSVWTTPLFGGAVAPGNELPQMARDIRVICQWVTFWSVLGVIGLGFWVIVMFTNG